MPRITSASLFRPLCLLTSDELPDLLVGLVQVIVDHDLVMRRLSTVRKLHLHPRLVQPLEDGLLLVRRPTPQSLLQDLHRRRLQEQEPWTGKCRVVCDLLDAL
jgi:hypothetical protein